jgi:tetraacyldisaccharide 4'-kinase
VTRALLPLVPLYAAASSAKNLAYDKRWLAQKQLQSPVVSVGNLSLGGSGKTPLTIRLAQLLQARGIAADVLSRGYGRQASTVERVQDQGSAEQFGDEPLLIAQNAGVPVFVGASRYSAGLLAEASAHHPAIHLLDDGFQHRQLARNVDIVALHREDFQQSLIPAGRLREGFSSLSRAQFVAMREEDQDLEGEVRRRGYARTIWWMQRRLEVPPVSRVVAFCAIARCDEFFSVVRSQGVSVVAMRGWRDHHAYTERDVAELIELQRQHAAEALVTTEKDLVRIPFPLRHTLESAGPLHALQLVVRLRDEAAAIEELLGLLPAIWQGRDRQTPADAVRK